MTDSRSIEETEWWKHRAQELMAERDSLLTRVGELEAERDGWQRTAEVNVAMVTEHQQAIRSLLTEREEQQAASLAELRSTIAELREALERIVSHGELEDDFGGRCGCVAIASSVLSTTDPKPTSSGGADTKSNPDSLGETTDSPHCPTCGSDDPAYTKMVPDVHPLTLCGNPFHSATTEGTSE